jgi:hypothetical protein
VLVHGHALTTGGTRPDDRERQQASRRYRLRGVAQHSRAGLSVFQVPVPTGGAAVPLECVKKSVHTTICRKTPCISPKYLGPVLLKLARQRMLHHRVVREAYYHSAFHELVRNPMEMTTSPHNTRWSVSRHSVGLLVVSTAPVRPRYNSLSCQTKLSGRKTYTRRHRGPTKRLSSRTRSGTPTFPWTGSRSTGGQIRCTSQHDSASARGETTSL